VDDAKVPVLTTHMTMSGGDDGWTGVVAADYIGTIVGQGATGLKSFRNAEGVDLNLVAVPGVADPAVIAEIFDLCASRADCMGIIDSPIGMDPNTVVDWHNGVAPWLHAAFNTTYAALYWPWCLTYDSVNRQNMWMPPSGFVAGQYAYNDYVGAPWTAPAGLNRGQLLKVTRPEMSPSQAQRDLLYGNGNRVNPIVNFSLDGVTIWGQTTLTRGFSLLEEVAVRRMLMYAEKTIATSSRFLTFEPNNPRTWARFTNLVTPALQYIKDAQGLDDFRVLCNSDTNPPIVRNRKEMNAKLLLKPTPTAEIITLDFVVLETGASFNEFAGA